jgi:hypothetical protein
MKKSINALTLAALGIVGLAAAAFAEDATSSKGYTTFPNTVRCQACGAEYHVLARATKDNAIEVKLEAIQKGANPKVH